MLIFGYNPRITPSEWHLGYLTLENLILWPITLESSIGHSYILAVTNSFSKWAEVIPLREVKKENVANFTQMHVIYHYDIPRYIITDNGKQFVNKLVIGLCETFEST